MVDEYTTFEEYGTVVKNSLEGILHDYNMSNEDKVQVIYATPPVAFAKFSQEMVNGQKPGPLVSFYLSDIDIDREQQMGGWKTLLTSSGYRMRAPVIAKLSYRVTINAIKESQADLLMSQLILSMPFHRPYATMLNGQWVTMTVEDFENNTETEVSSDSDKISKRSTTIVIDRAYFDHPIQVNNSYIKKINTHIYSVDSSLGDIDENY